MSHTPREIVASAIGAAHRATDGRLNNVKDMVLLKLAGRGPSISAEDFVELITQVQSLIAEDINALLNAVQKR